MKEDILSRAEKPSGRIRVCDLIYDPSAGQREAPKTHQDQAIIIISLLITNE